MSNSLEIHIDSSAVAHAIRQLPFFDKVALKWIRHATEDNISWAQGFLAKYPPPPPHSTYIRTTTLGPGWQYEIRSTMGHVRATLANPVEYAPYVQDETRQARIHRGRWPIIQMLLRTPVRLFRMKYEDALRRVSLEMAIRLSSLGK